MRARSEYRQHRRSAIRPLVLLALLALVAVIVASASANSTAPVLRVEGTTLAWTSVPGATAYEVKETVPGKKASTVKTKSRVFSAHLHSKATRYRVRASAPAKSKWSNAVTLKAEVPKEEPPKEEKEKPKKEKEKEEPKEEEAPKEEGTIKFTPGIDAGYEEHFEIPGAAILGAKVVRLEVPMGNVSQSAVLEFSEKYEAKGITPLLLYSFNGTMPSAAQVKNITALARIPGVKTIEFGNETNGGYQYGGDGPTQASYKQRARTYAERFVEASKLLKPFGIGLLAQGSPGGTKSSVWDDEMFAAEPELSKYVSGWTVHPYGSTGQTQMAETIADLAKHGDKSTPIDVTEWGLATDNGRTLSDNYGFPVNLTYAQAGNLMNEQVAKFKAQAGGRLRYFIVYQARDQAVSGTSKEREYYFGALQHEDQKKPGYTEVVEALMKE